MDFEKQFGNVRHVNDQAVTRFFENKIAATGKDSEEKDFSKLYFAFFYMTKLCYEKFGLSRF